MDRRKIQATQWNMDVFRPFIEKTLDEWLRDELLEETGLRATDIILKEHEDAPPIFARSHPYNKIFNTIVDKIAEEYLLEMQETRTMAIILRSQKELAKIIRTWPTRVQFEKTKNEIFDSLPQEVKARFGQQFFVIKGKFLFPVVVLNPYSVPPRGGRDMWLKMYHSSQVKNKQRQLKSDLVYWYGSSGGYYSSNNNAYSMVATSKLRKNMTVPSFEQKKKGRGKNKKYFNDPSEKMLMTALKEYVEDSRKKPDQRPGRMLQSFLEDWEKEIPKPTPATPRELNNGRNTNTTDSMPYL